jgi:hypothetical protein
MILPGIVVDEAMRRCGKAKGSKRKAEEVIVLLSVMYVRDVESCCLRGVEWDVDSLRLGCAQRGSSGGPRLGSADWSVVSTSIHLHASYITFTQPPSRCFQQLCTEIARDLRAASRVIVDD